MAKPWSNKLRGKRMSKIRRANGMHYKKAKVLVSLTKKKNKVEHFAWVSE